MPLDTDLVAEVIADTVAILMRPLVDKIAALETRLAVVDSLVAAHDVGALRERVAVIEVREPIPGPPGPPGPEGRAGLSVKDLTFAYDGDTRQLSVHDAGADERAACTLVGLPAYRGVWQTLSYARGDLVTWGGGAWHCVAESTIAKPGESPDWMLMIKRGRDGKDAR